MKKMKIPVILFLFTWVFFACGGGNTTTEETDVVALFEDETHEAVCIWDKIALREEAHEKGKWITSVSLGEKVVYLNENAVDSTPARPINYYKIALLDGKQGWVRSDFIVLNGKPAVFTTSTPYYSRPDLLTKTDKSFSSMDIVGVKSTQGDWIEVAGKRTGATWIESGWVRSNNVSYKDIDIAVAKFALAALTIKDQNKQIEAIEEILENPDFQGSTFINDLNEILKTKYGSVDPDEEDYEEDFE